MNNLEKFRQKIKNSSLIEDQKISQALKWLKKKNLENKMIVQKISITNLKDWSVKKNGNISHKSSQFFTIEGVKIKNAFKREVKTWDPDKKQYVSNRDNKPRYDEISGKKKT